MRNDKLSVTNRHEMFCLEFIVDFNATRAARAVGYSKKTARSQGHRLLTNADIQKRIAELIEKRKQKVELTAENVLKELGIVGLSNIKDYIEKGESDLVMFKSFDNITREQAGAIESIEYDKENKIKFKLHNKEKALELALRHFGLLTDNLKIRGALTHTHNISMKKLRDAYNAIKRKRDKRKS